MLMLLSKGPPAKRDVEPRVESVLFLPPWSVQLTQRSVNVHIVPYCFARPTLHDITDASTQKTVLATTA